MIINEAYFINTLTHIPNLTGCVQDEGFKRFMRQKAEEALYETLGVCLVNEIESYLDENCLLDPEGSAPDHIKWLVYGHEYTPDSNCNCNSSCNCCSVGNCNTVKWNGITDTDNRESYLAFYVYHEWMCKPTSKCCDDPEKEEELRRIKRIDAWNEFVNWVQYTNRCSVSLIQFLKDHKEFFPSHVGQCFKLKNYWGI